MPYRFLKDIATADVAFEAWGETREELFIVCAAALLRTMVEEPEEVQRLDELTISVKHEALDLLLYSFLEELVFYKDARRLLLHADQVMISGEEGAFSLEAIVRGEEITPLRHSMLVDVKAVTLYKFKVFHDENVWKANIILDV
ncbi:MAG TPA: archease [Desulfuromonadaceae bacterium]|jgi:SHS2 domain-containing protein